MITPTELARAVGVHRSTASRWISGWEDEAMPAAPPDVESDDGFLELDPIDRQRLIVRELRQLIRIALQQETTRDVASLFIRLDSATEKLEALESGQVDDFDEWDPTEVAERIVQLLRDPEIAAEVERLR